MIAGITGERNVCTAENAENDDIRFIHSKIRIVKEVSITPPPPVAPLEHPDNDDSQDIDN